MKHPVWPLVVVVACGGSEPQALEFAGEAPVLPGLDLDTGYLPADSPAQVRLEVSSAGTLSLLASGEAEGDELAPIAGSGAASLAASLRLDVFARLDAGSFDFEGEVESVELIVPPVEKTFDPFLLDGELALEADIPAQELLSAPLGGVPGGTLTLSVTGGTLVARFTGTCAAAREGIAAYHGEVRWSGQLELSATIEVDVPIGDDPSYPLEFSVPIPDITSAVDLGARSTADGSPSIGPSPCRPDDDGDACGPATCSGCCDATGGCATGNSDEACGADGAACQACDEAEACGGEVAGSCSPVDFYLVEIRSGVMPTTDCAGEPWDAATPPDPYLDVSHLLGEERTAVVDDTFEPEWNQVLSEPFRADRLIATTLGFIVYDAEPGADTTAAKCRYAPAADDFDGEDVGVACALGTDCPGQYVALVLRFSLAP